MSIAHFPWLMLHFYKIEIEIENVMNENIYFSWSIGYVASVGVQNGQLENWIPLHSRLIWFLLQVESQNCGVHAI